MKTIIFSVYFTIQTFVCLSQTANENLLKYWVYRNRLKDEFMTCVCDENGGSLLASIKTNNYVKWGDGTIDLGFYIGILA
jgi:hypothetical protein